MGILAVLMQCSILKRVLLVSIFHPPIFHRFLASTYSANRNSVPTCGTLSRYPLFLYFFKLSSLLFGKYVSSAVASSLWRLIFTLRVPVVADVHVDNRADGIDMVAAADSGMCVGWGLWVWIGNWVVGAGWMYAMAEEH